MNESKRFKKYVIDYNNAKRKLKDEKHHFEGQIRRFMENKNIPVDQIRFFGNTFGIDITLSIKKIPLDVLSDFCKEFGCEYEYTNDERRYIFSFDGLDMGH